MAHRYFDAISPAVLKIGSVECALAFSFTSYGDVHESTLILSFFPAQVSDAVTPHMALSLRVCSYLLQVPAESGEMDDTGSDEAIVPTDMNLLTGLPLFPLLNMRISSKCQSHDV